MKFQACYAFGVAWPLVLPAVAAVVCRIVEPEWYQFGGIVLTVVTLGLFAAPFLAACLFWQLPPSWPKGAQIAVAFVLTILISGIQAYAGLLVFTLICPWVE